MSGDARAAQIVRFWQAVEVFSPQKVPERSRPPFKPDAREIVLDLAVDDVPPWDPEHWLARRPPRTGMAWQFSIYGGLFQLSAVRDALTTAFGPDDSEVEARVDGQAAMFAFTLDASSYLVADSATLSVCAWAIGRLRETGACGAGLLDGFRREERGFVDALNKLTPPQPIRSSSGLANAAEKVREASAAQVKRAAADAASAGAAAVGDVVKGAAAVAVGSVAGPVVGGIAGAVAGKFAEKLLTPPARKADHGDGAGGPVEGAPPKDAKSRVAPWHLTTEVVADLVNGLGRALGVADLLNVGHMRVKCVQVPVREADEAREQNFLNSFIADDLCQIEHAVRSGDVGVGITRYLADNRAVRADLRVDVRTAPEEVVSGVTPSRIPSGRWPTDLAKPLVLSQQFAVNQIIAELGGGSGIFAVNGPPGTGKTTLLRDVIAAVVVDRAQRLVDLRLSHPVHAFGEVIGRVPVSPRRSASVRAMRRELTGFEVVVATAGNKAAENITTEIPGVNAVAGAQDEACAADYFADLASRVLGEPAWGMIAARLGKRSHRRAFVKRFWWGDEPTKPRRERARSESPTEARAPGMKGILDDAAASPMTADVWADAVRRFKDALYAVQRLSSDRQRVANTIDRFHAAERQLGRLEIAVHAAHVECQRLYSVAVAARARAANAGERLRTIEIECREHTGHQPGFWVSLSTWFRAGREWHARDRQLVEQRNRLVIDLDRSRRALASHDADLAAATAELQRHESELGRGRRQITEAREEIELAVGRWPGTVPFRPDYPDDERFQLCAPWADREFTAARNRLFLEALRLHKAFVLGAEPRLRGNLEVAMQVIRDGTPLGRETLQTVWQTLFMVVPVVSTTFASLPRLCRGLGTESFGWLFVDEAGQATPQDALGGIWRARRTVIVGDPQQLEPIVSLPAAAQRVLMREHGVDRQWAPATTSAQRVADRLARHGTWLPTSDGNDQVWVGAPLRVHRRCDRPMFDISNQIAYGGDLIVYGTRRSDGFPGANCWIDVRSGQSEKKWIPAEGIALACLLRDLRELGVPREEIRVISPFRDVVSGVREVAASRFGWDFVSKNVGTVHTVQGQEAEVVIIVLGTAPRNGGARSWAAQTPNLLNVAVSRAKRRLYVIGDRDNWREERFFEVLATHLPVRRSTAADGGARSAERPL